MLIELVLLQILSLNAVVFSCVGNLRSIDALSLVLLASRFLFWKFHIGGRLVSVFCQDLLTFLDFIRCLLCLLYGCQ